MPAAQSSTPQTPASGSGGDRTSRPSRQPESGDTQVTRSLPTGPHHATGRYGGRRPQRDGRRSWPWLVAVGVVTALLGVLAANTGTAPPTRTVADAMAATQPARAAHHATAPARAADLARDPLSVPAESLPTVNLTPCAPTGSMTVPGCAPIAPTPTPTLPFPLPTGPSTSVDCFPGSLQPECLNPTTATPAPTGTTAPSCTGEDCIPQPVTTTPNRGGGAGGGGGNNGGDCSLWDSSTWLDCLFRGASPTR
jgi:septal ring-binding cell division protein DamX